MKGNIMCKKKIKPASIKCTEYGECLKGHYQENVVKIIPLNHKLGINFINIYKLLWFETSVFRVRK
jgi:hypothetical protein